MKLIGLNCEWFFGSAVYWPVSWTACSAEGEAAGWGSAACWKCSRVMCCCNVASVTSCQSSPGFMWGLEAGCPARIRGVATLHHIHIPAARPAVLIKPCKPWNPSMLIHPRFHFKGNLQPNSFLFLCVTSLLCLCTLLFFYLYLVFYEIYVDFTVTRGKNTMCVWSMNNEMVQYAK